MPDINEILDDAAAVATAIAKIRRNVREIAGTLSETDQQKLNERLESIHEENRTLTEEIEALAAKNQG